MAFPQQRGFTGDAFTQPTHETSQEIVARRAAEPRVRLYFINYAIVDQQRMITKTVEKKKNDGSGESITAELEEENSKYGYIKGHSSVLSFVDGKIYHIPPIGESLEVPQRVANDLMNRLRIFDPKLGTLDGFTTEAGVAMAVRAAFERGDLDISRKDVRQNDQAALNFQTLLQSSYQQISLDRMSTEALEKELANRKASALSQEIAPDTVIADADMKKKGAK